MKDPWMARMLGLTLGLALGAGALVMTIPHKETGHIHHIGDASHAHTTLGCEAHSLKTKSESDLAGLMSWMEHTSARKFPHLTAMNGKGM